MKKFFTTVLLFSVFIVANSLWAGNGFLDNTSKFKKHNLKNNLLFTENNRYADNNMSFGEGKLAISLGYGGLSGGLLKAVLRTYEDEAGYSFSSFGPIHFRGEYGLSDKIGLVLSVNHNSWKASWTHMDSATIGKIHQDEFKRSVTSILARINIHFGVTERLDPYWGIGAGYRMPEYSFTSTDPGYDISWKSPFNVGFETTLGLRFYLMEGLGLYGELGLAQSLIQGGLVVAF